MYSPPSWGFDVPLATALCKTFLLRMLNDTRVVEPTEEEDARCTFEIKHRFS
jgi:hypothetical protein